MDHTAKFRSSSSCRNIVDRGQVLHMLAASQILQFKIKKCVRTPRYDTKLYSFLKTTARIFFKIEFQCDYLRLNWDLPEIQN